MLWKNLVVALALFFAWLGVDAVVSLAGNPLDGVHYPLQSHRLRSPVYADSNWTDKRSFVAPFFFLVFALVWWYPVQREGLARGARIAAIFSAFILVSFWFVTAVSADLLDLEVNRYWLASMIYCNVSFFLYGLLGRGTLDDLHF